MWQQFDLSTILLNVSAGFTSAITALTTSPPPAPPPYIEQYPESSSTSLTSSTIFFSQELITIGKDPEINAAVIDAEGEKRKLFGDLIANPNQYPELSQSDKILVTQDVIQNLKRLGKTHTKPINSIIDGISEAGKDSFFNKYEAIVISNYYVDLNKTTKEQIPEAIKTPPSFQCQRVADPRNGSAGGGDTQGRRSQNAFVPPPPLFLGSRRSENRTPAQLQKSKEMHAEMKKHIESERERGMIHPAAQRPITNLTKSPSNRGLRTREDAMNYVFKRGGITTFHAQTQGSNSRENTDKAIAENLKNASSSITKQLELTRRALGRDIVNGSINDRETKNLRKKLTDLENLERKYQNDLAKLDAINATTKSPPPKRRPSPAPAQPLSARSASLSYGTGRR